MGSGAHKFDLNSRRLRCGRKSRAARRHAAASSPSSWPRLWRSSARCREALWD